MDSDFASEIKGLAPPAVAATVNYFVAPVDGSVAFQHSDADPATGERKRNFSRRNHEVVIENLRGMEDSATLDTTGFQLYRRSAMHTSFANDEEIEREYYPESIELIKELTGASRVVLFDHTIRRRRPGQVDDSPQKRQPVLQVHVDQTGASAVTRIHKHLPAHEVPALLGRRYQVLNLWRPITHPAHEWPLALCDYRSVDPQSDTAPLRVIYPNYVGETLAVKYNPNHRWKYFRGMTTEEVILFKCFDSSQDVGISVFAPHCSFEDSTSPRGSPLRESIELRALVFYD